jgi:uncharacterized protein (TIGR03435 family)
MNHWHTSATNTLHAVSALAVLAIAALPGPLVSAQAQMTAVKKFEVATIRRNPSTDTPAIRQSVVTQPNGRRLTSEHVTARELIRYAYGYQFRPLSLVTGGPDWLDAERWDVTAQSDTPFEPVPRPGMLPPDAGEMLRSMLIERMKLKVRTEMREQTVYALVVDRADGKLGTNLTPAEGKCHGSLSAVDFTDPRAKEMPRCPLIIGGNGDGTARFEMGNITIPDLASMLGNFPIIDLLVVDQTGLTGRYDMKVRFTGGMQLSATGPNVPKPVTDTEIPLLPGAVRQQLGLRLDRRRMPVETIIIESVERPTAN